MVSVDRAREWGDSTIWIDARPDDEFARDHVPGAISLNEDRWNELFPQFSAAWSPGEKDHCLLQRAKLRSRPRSGRTAAQESAASDGKCFVLKGGWEAWLKKNR